MQKSVEPGGVVTVRIASSVANNNFRGFMLHAVEVKSVNGNGPSLGTFREVADQAKVLTCTPGLHVMRFSQSLFEFINLYFQFLM